MNRVHKGTKDLVSRKIKSTGYIYLPGYQYREAGFHLKLRSCLHDAVINYSPSIGNYINKHTFYIQYPPRRVKDKNMNDIENSLCVRNVIILTPVFII